MQDDSAFENNQNFPGFIPLCPGGYPVGGAANWRSAFLPGAYQGTHVNTSKVDPTKLIDHVHNTRLTDWEQKDQFDLLQSINSRHLSDRPGEASQEARIRSFELAYRMQIQATDAFDVQKEPKHIQERYGKEPQNRQLLMGKRLARTRSLICANVAWQRAAVG
ncbi:MAG: DUF1501 domain-containing protein [Planctomycetaceae bacterium]|nr:DUF1501 domain-containing protein [Planctomycetaceae bacterium]MBL4886169.1 DUF1501 domain-containing protein [Planctomycetaceae bacterium]